jgi:hypothetical protein
MEFFGSWQMRIQTRQALQLELELKLKVDQIFSSCMAFNPPQRIVFALQAFVVCDAHVAAVAPLMREAEPVLHLLLFRSFLDSLGQQELPGH